ncbi:short chain dehydrogenase/reductase [Cryomyces antarcticus]
MLRLFARKAPSSIRNSFISNSSYQLIPKATMATGKSENHELKASKLFDVSHVTAIVTGGGTGIGLMITQALVANGAKVYITGRREEALKKTVDLYSTGPGSIHALPGDVSDKADVQRLVKEIEGKESKGIQLLVNNAGIARDDQTKFSSNGQPDMSDPQAISNHFMKSPPEAWEDTFRTNVTGAFYMSMAFLPLLAKGREVTPGYTSSVVNVTSISGFMKGSSSGQFAYASSKAAFQHMSRMLATTFASTKVRVNIIAPGILPSEMTAGDSGEDNKSTLDMEMSNPAGRTGHDSDMAASILFLAGPGGLFYNEQTLFPDGGESKHRASLTSGSVSCLS